MDNLFLINTTEKVIECIRKVQEDRKKWNMCM